MNLQGSPGARLIVAVTLFLQALPVLAAEPTLDSYRRGLELVEHLKTHSQTYPFDLDDDLPAASPAQTAAISAEAHLACMAAAAPGVNECEVVEQANGRLMLNMRNYDRTQRQRQVAPLCHADRQPPR